MFHQDPKAGGELYMHCVVTQEEWRATEQKVKLQEEELQVQHN